MSRTGLSRAETMALLAGAAGVALLVAWWHRRRSRDRMPTNWRRVGHVSELSLFPLKSGGALNLQKADCTDLGLVSTEDNPLKVRDRFFMVYRHESLNFVSARQYPSMVMIMTTAADDKSITFEAPSMPKLEVKLPSGPAKKICKMWFEEKIHVLDCGDAAADWLNSYLTKGKGGLRLGYYRAEILPRRDLSKEGHAPFFKHYKKRRGLRGDDAGALADMSPFLLMTESSVADVRSRLAPNLDSLTARWFRPNLVVKGSKPFEEDDWEWIRMGEDAVFKNVKLCTRCILTTVDPETGVKNPGMEPLRTLKKFRQLTDPEGRKVEGDSPALGINLGLRHAGTVKVGDPVYVGK